MKRDSRYSREGVSDSEGRIGTTTVLTLVGTVTVIVAALIVFAINRDSGDGDSNAAAAPASTCGVLDKSGMTDAAMGLSLNGGTGTCDGFGSTVSLADTTQRFAMRISYVNQGTAAQNLTLRLELPAAITPEVSTARLYDGAGGSGEQIATGSLLWSDGGLKMGAYEPDQSAVVIAYGTVQGKFDPAGCKTLRDPIKAFATSRGQDKVAARLTVQVGAGC